METSRLTCCVAVIASDHLRVIFATPITQEENGQRIQPDCPVYRRSGSRRNHSPDEQKVEEPIIESVPAHFSAARGPSRCLRPLRQQHRRPKTELAPLFLSLRER